MAKPETIRKILLMLNAAYPGANMTPETPGLYANLLGDVPDDVLEAAVLDHIARSQFYPRVSELRAAAANLVTGVEDYPPGAEAWGQVVTVLNGRFGLPSQIDPGEIFAKNPLTVKAVNALGWYNLRMSVNQVADRARFIEAYEVYRRRARIESVALPAVRALAEKLRAPGSPAGHLPFAVCDDDSPEELEGWADIDQIMAQERASAFDM